MEKRRLHVVSESGEAVKAGRLVCYHGRRSASCYQGSREVARGAWARPPLQRGAGCGRRMHAQSKTLREWPGSLKRCRLGLDLGWLLSCALCLPRMAALQGALSCALRGVQGVVSPRRLRCEQRALLCPPKASKAYALPLTHVFWAILPNRRVTGITVYEMGPGLGLAGRALCKTKPSKDIGWSVENAGGSMTGAAHARHWSVLVPPPPEESVNVRCMLCCMHEGRSMYAVCMLHEGRSEMLEGADGG